MERKTMPDVGEEWWPVAGWPYEVSSRGEVRRTVRRTRFSRRPDRLRPSLAGRGYPAVELRDNGRHQRVYVHRLVVQAFVGPIPPGHEVNHLDGNKQNNHWANLEIVTPAENHAHAVRTGLKQWPTKGKCKLTPEQVIEIRSLRRAGMSLPKLGKRYGVSFQAIQKIIRGQTWRHVEEAA